MNKKILGLVAVLVVGLLLGGGYLLGKSSVPHSTGGVVNNNGVSFTNGADFGLLPVTVNWTGGKIAAKSNTAFWKNTTGMVQYVDYGEVSTDGTASSTYKVYAVATTSAISTLYDSVATPTSTEGKMLINAFTIATSSIATTTTSIDKAPAGKTIRVPDGYQVNIYLVNSDTGCASQGSGVCETATSSNRGFNLPWRLRYHN